MKEKTDLEEEILWHLLAVLHVLCIYGRMESGQMAM